MVDLGSRLEERWGQVKLTRFFLTFFFKEPLKYFVKTICETVGRNLPTCILADLHEILQNIK
jgi:hypothetical protein